MTSALLPPPIVFRAFTQTGTPAPLAGGILTFYQAGTSTPQAAYSDATGTTPLANPLTLDANGQANFWLKSGLVYKINLTDASLVQQTGWPVDNIVADAGGAALASLADTSSASNGDSLIGVKNPNTGAVATTQHQKNLQTVSAADFGPYGTGDDTIALQNAINATPAGRVLSGNGLTYTVTSLQIPSNFSMQDFNLITKAGTTDYVAPITISGLASPKTNIRLQNIAVNGNRSAQTNIVGSAEDGGRCGFRILGQVSDLQIIDCSATACAGYGLELFSNWSSVTGAPSPITDTACAFNNIFVSNFISTGNRGHGAACDSLANVIFEGCTFTNNGLNLSGCSWSASPNYVSTFPWSDGHLGDPQGSTLFANGIDFEGYGVGSGINGLWVSNCITAGNAGAGVLFLDGKITPNAAYFATRKNIFLDNLEADAGAGFGDGSCVEFNPIANIQEVNITMTGGGFQISVSAVSVTDTGGTYPTPYILPGQTLIGPGIPLGTTIMPYGTGSTTGIGGTGTYYLSQNIPLVSVGTAMVITNFVYQNVNVTNLRGTGVLTLKGVLNFYATGTCYVTSGTNVLIDASIGFCGIVGGDVFTAPGANVQQYFSHVYTARYDQPSITPVAPTVAYGGGQTGTFVQNSVSIFRDYLDGWVEYSAQFDFTPGSVAASYNALVTPPTGYTFKGFTQAGAAVAATAAPVKAYPADGTAKIYYDCPVTTIMNCACRFLVKKN